MPLQLLSIFFITFILLFLPPVLSTGQVAKPGCKDRCGNLSIPYPFGVGSDCSLDPSFTLTCNTSTDPPTPDLTVLDKEVIEINDTYVRVKYPNLVSVCYDLSVQTGINATTAVSYKQSMNMNLAGTPYSLSRENRLTAIGCDAIVLVIGQSEGTPALGIRKSNGTSSVVGGCSTVCLDKNIDPSGFGYCSNNDTSPGNGCCQAIISEAGYNFPSGRGYKCNCLPGYEGNPYLLRGCQRIYCSGDGLVAEWLGQRFEDP